MCVETLLPLVESERILKYIKECDFFFSVLLGFSKTLACSERSDVAKRSEVLAVGLGSLLFDSQLYTDQLCGDDQRVREGGLKRLLSIW